MNRGKENLTTFLHSPACALPRVLLNTLSLVKMTWCCSFGENQCKSGKRCAGLSWLFRAVQNRGGEWVYQSGICFTIFRTFPSICVGKASSPLIPRVPLAEKREMGECCQKDTRQCLRGEVSKVAYRIKCSGQLPPESSFLSRRSIHVFLKYVCCCDF